MQRECVAAQELYDEALHAHFARQNAADDPIFAAIAEWKSAEAEEIATAGPDNENENSPAHERAVRRYDAAREAFCACAPTTPAGLAAALAFARDRAKKQKQCAFLEDYREWAPMFAASMATAAARLATAARGGV